MRYLNWAVLLTNPFHWHHYLPAARQRTRLLGTERSSTAQVTDFCLTTISLSFSKRTWPCINKMLSQKSDRSRTTHEMLQEYQLADASDHGFYMFCFQIQGADSVFQKQWNCNLFLALLRFYSNTNLFGLNKDQDWWNGSTHELRVHEVSECEGDSGLRLRLGRRMYGVLYKLFAWGKLRLEQWISFFTVRHIHELHHVLRPHLLACVFPILVLSNCCICQSLVSCIHHDALIAD